MMHYKEQEKLKHHPVYKSIDRLEDIQSFMEQHVFAVWEYREHGFVL